jgi:hypothetical protein
MFVNVYTLTIGGLSQVKVDNIRKVGYDVLAIPAAAGC